jgi:hypothetical protein
MQVSYQSVARPRPHLLHRNVIQVYGIAHHHGAARGGLIRVGADKHSSTNFAEINNDTHMASVSNRRHARLQWQTHTRGAAEPESTAQAPCIFADRV